MESKFREKILQELIILFFSAYIKSSVICKDDANELTQKLLDMPLEGHLMHEQLEYTTRNEAEAHLNNSINKYADTDLSDWATLFVESIQPMSIPDKELSAKVTVGCIHFFENIKYMVNNSYLNKAFEKEG